MLSKLIKPLGQDITNKFIDEDIKSPSIITYNEYYKNTSVLKKYKQIEFMQDKIGQIFDGTITGVTEWGVYVEEKETWPSDGPTRQLHGDREMNIFFSVDLFDYNCQNKPNTPTL